MNKIFKLEVGKTYIFSDFNSPNFRGRKIKITKIDGYDINSITLDDNTPVFTPNDTKYFLPTSKEIKVFNDE